jgi:hypothetical protein
MDPKEAVKELRRRQKDPNLIKKVNDFLKGDIPEPLKDFLNKPPIAVLARNIFTPDYELDIFLKKVSDINGEPFLFEHTEDKFIAENDDKHALGKLSFYLNTDKHGKNNTHNISIIDFHLAEGKKISQVHTLGGERLVDFHHKILSKYYPDILNNIVDGSDWVYRTGKSAKDYYSKFLSIFIVHSILFETVRLDGEEGAFFRKVFYPNLLKTIEIFGVKPIICPILSGDESRNSKWWGFSGERMKYILNFIKKS